MRKKGERHMKKKPEFYSNRVQYLDVDRIAPNAQQPRRQFSDEGLRELAQSIIAYGILQPLTVRKQGKDYELVAGERRLRAAKAAGLRQVPCLIAQVGDKDAGLLALIENLQRRDLNCFEEAEAIAGLLRRYGLSQEQAAQKLGKSQSAIANKLRLLRLPEDIRRQILQENLTERHTRALLRLSDGESQCRALEIMAKRRLNVAESEALVERILQEKQVTPPSKRTNYIIKDVRLFLNSIDRSLEIMRQAGIPAQLGRENTREGIVLTIRIPRTTQTK